MAESYNKVPWKRNLRKIPKKIQEYLSSLSSELVIVAATKKVPLADIDKSVYAHLEIKREDGAIVVPPHTMPPVSMGKFSECNLNGWEVKRDDLPKITKTYIWETPNFGDAATYGTHTHYQDREVYQREYYEPRHLPISMEILKAPESGTGSALIKFAVECILDRSRADFEQDLLFCLNILQENTGAIGVYPSDASRQDFIGTITLDWEIFPPGTEPEMIDAFSKGKGATSRQVGVLEDRLKLFSTLKPKIYLRGTGSFGSYVGAQYADDLVVFENLNYGNALYVLYDDWEQISKRSRLDLLKSKTGNFDRFLHRECWKERFTNHLQAELNKRKSGQAKPRRSRK